MALEENETFDIVSLSPGKNPVGRKWVLTVKVSPNGTVAQLKVRLVAKRHAQIYGVDYFKTFSPLAKQTKAIYFSCCNFWLAFIST